MGALCFIQRVCLARTLNHYSINPQAEPMPIEPRTHSIADRVTHEKKERIEDGRTPPVGIRGLDAAPRLCCHHRFVVALRPLAAVDLGRQEQGQGNPPTRAAQDELGMAGKSVLPSDMASHKLGSSSRERTPNGTRTTRRDLAPPCLTTPSFPSPRC